MKGSTGTGCTRRLALSSLGASALSLLTFGAVAWGGGQDSGELAAVLGALMYHPDTARVLGQLYRRQHPEEDNPALLIRLALSALAPLGAGAQRPAAADLAGRLEALVRDDFARGLTVQLDGWILSRTEARLCALCR